MVRARTPEALAMRRPLRWIADHARTLTLAAGALAAPAALAIGGPLWVARPARAAKQYGPGVTDSEIKIGNTGPYSGPLSNASPIPLTMAAYFKMINDQGGVNGRKLTWISYDDAYSPPKTVEQTRRLVEQVADRCLDVAQADGANLALRLRDDHVRLQRPRPLDHLEPVGRLRHHPHVRLGIEEDAQPAADHDVVVGEQHPYAAFNSGHAPP